jgi:hypothetical protein
MIVYLECAASLIKAEDGGITFLQNFGKPLQNYTASHLRRQ